MALKKNDAKAMAALEAKLDEELEAAEVEAAEATEAAEDTEVTETPEVTEAAEEVEATEAAEEAEATPEPEAEETLVKVENLSHSTLYQHSTGLTIAGKSTKSLRNDGWLKNQIAAKLLKRV